VFAELDDFQPTAIQDAEDGAPIRVFFGSEEARDAAARALGVAFGSHVFVETIDVEDQDWAARSQSQLRAITVGRITVAPPWDAEKRGQTPFCVTIQPSMGFGTGHHASTRLMLKALQTLPIDDRTVLDIGCGSGVLAIAAVTLGARSAMGIDVDKDALENARENAKLNNVGERVMFEEGDFRERRIVADIVLANLTALLHRSAARLAGCVARGGHLVVSGFMDSERHPVLEALESLLVLEALDQEDEWMAALLRDAYKSRQI
jgi:ribosomal protein L11 methyltransferase